MTATARSKSKDEETFQSANNRLGVEFQAEEKSRLDLPKTREEGLLSKRQQERRRKRSPLLLREFTMNDGGRSKLGEKKAGPVGHRFLSELTL